MTARQHATVAALSVVVAFALVAAMFYTMFSSAPGKIDYVDTQPVGYWHAFWYGNPNQQEWTCVGKCPPEVRAVERAESERHKAHHHTIELWGSK